MGDESFEKGILSKEESGEPSCYVSIVDRTPSLSDFLSSDIILFFFSSSRFIQSSLVIINGKKEGRTT